MNHPVRRKDREITDPLEMDEILGRAVFGTLAMGGEEGLYAVPMNFVHKSGKIYFHCANEGRKLDILQSNPRACFSVVVDLGYAKSDRACGWGMFYESVTLWGPVSFVDSPEEKGEILAGFIEKSSGEKFRGTFSPDDVKGVTVFCLDAESRTGKARRP
ncbi:MAG: pyridoxamine 5'-phosphate oxidase family protein [Synergistaceae bacterium]|nr:pyridoxamine 5'-phosphate oxidase family protein [Synergistaceae bacterium]